MSARRAILALKPAARRDLRSIAVFTGEQWGTDQQNDSLNVIHQAMTTLSENPWIGRMRDDVGSGLYSYRVRQHVLYYRADAESVTIIRILHAKMDAGMHID